MDDYRIPGECPCSACVRLGNDCAFVAMFWNGTYDDPDDSDDDDIDDDDIDEDRCAAASTEFKRIYAIVRERLDTIANGYALPIVVRGDVTRYQGLNRAMIGLAMDCNRCIG